MHIYIYICAYTSCSSLRVSSLATLTLSLVSTLQLCCCLWVCCYPDSYAMFQAVYIGVGFAWMLDIHLHCTSCVYLPVRVETWHDLIVTLIHELCWCSRREVVRYSMSYSWHGRLRFRNSILRSRCWADCLALVSTSASVNDNYN